jgi:hypothetical protein
MEQENSTTDPQRPDFLLLARGFHWINEYPLNH